jgi:hypothetical protein
MAADGHVDPDDPAQADDVAAAPRDVAQPEQSPPLQTGVAMNFPETQRSIALGIAGKIPQVGGAVAMVLGYFWPSTGNSIWDRVREEVQAVVDAAILDQELSFNNASLSGLKTTMRNYNQAKAPQAGELLVVAIGKADDLFQHLTQSKNAIHMIPLCIALSHLHLSLLAEQQRHGPVQFGPAGGPPVAYNPAWGAQLTRQRRLYRRHFRDVYPQWLAWRATKITGGSLDVQDVLVPGSRVTYAQSDSKPAVKMALAAAGTRLLNQAVAAMAELLESTFLLNLYDPTTSSQPPDVDPRLAYLELGPFCAASTGLLAHGPVATDVKDLGGFVKAIRIRAHETTAQGLTPLDKIRAGLSVEGMQLRYAGRDGAYSAGPQAPAAGVDYQVDLAGAGHFTGLEVTFNREMVFSATVRRSDGSVAGPYGKNPLVYHGDSKQSALVPPTYALVGADYAAGRGAWSQLVGTFVLTFRFAHASLKDAPVLPPDGTLLHQPSSAISIVYGGARFHIPDPRTLAALYPGWPVQEASDDYVRGLPLLPRDGTLLSEQSGKVWVIVGGARFHVPDPQTFGALYDPRALRMVPNGALGTNEIPLVPADGTVVREHPSKIWVIFAGARFPVPDVDMLADLYEPSAVQTLWTGALAANQVGLIPRDGTLLREVSSTDVFEMRAGRKTRVTPASGSRVLVLWDGALDAVP